MTLYAFDYAFVSSRLRRFFLAAMVGCACGAGMAVQTDTQGIHAVPARPGVVIDGDTGDWDLSGQVLMCYDVETLEDVYSARVAAMYDADNLYIAIHWKDPVPLGNSHDPHYAASLAWAGDCVQLRFRTDRITHVTAWYYAPKDEPAIQLDLGKDLGEPFGGGDIFLPRLEGAKLERGAEMAFRKDADGKGYVQEIKIPWSLIAGKKFVPGDKFQMGVDLLWGEGDWPVHRYSDNLQEGASGREFFFTNFKAWGNVVLEPKGDLKLPEPEWTVALAGEQPAGPVDIAYDLPKDSRVTLAIDDANGNRVRNLIAAQPRKAGSNVEKWDGRTDDGRLAPPGEYRFRAISHDGIHLSYVMSFVNPGNPTWDTSDNRGAFYGDHTAPQAAAAGGKYAALATPMGEAGKHLIGVDSDGQRLWGLNNRQAFDGGEISLATDGKILWVGNEGKQSTIYRVDIATGKYAPWQRTGKDAAGKDFQVLDLVVSEVPGMGGAEHGAPPNMAGLALGSGGLAVAFAKEDRIRVLDPENGDLHKEYSVPSPRAVTWAADGGLIALSRDKLLKIGADGGVRPFAEGSYPGGFGLAANGQGEIFLSVRGTDQNVKVFSPDGKMVREIGKKGGRPDHGPYDPDAMRNPGRIAVDPQNRVWVPESTMNPKRTSIWDATTGKLLKDLVGTTTYAGAGSINPDDPAMAFSGNTVFQIDLGTGSWRPIFSLGKSSDPNAVFPARAGFRDQIFNRDGATYIYNTDRTRTILCTIHRNGKWLAAAALGTVLKENDPECQVNFQHPLMSGHAGEMFAWADKNGDGLTQADELSFAPTKTHCPFWGSLPGRDGAITLLDADKQQALLKFSVKSHTACGAPVYDPAHPLVLPFPLVKTWGEGGEGMIHGGSKGRMYLNMTPLTTADDQGHVLGTYPSNNVSVHGSHSARSARAGYLIGPNSILGTADMGAGIGEVFSMNGNLGENFLFTEDALWIQSVFKDTRGGYVTPDRAVRGMNADAMTAGGESFGGDFLRTPDGKVYLVAGVTDARVMEVTGLDSIKRFAGRFTYTPAQFAEAKSQAAGGAGQAAARKSYSVARAATPPVLDAAAWPELMDGKSPAAVSIQESASRRYGRAAMRWDDHNLYVAWRVTGPAKPRNAGQDWRLLFKTGDVVDLMIGAGNPKAGNSRVLVAFPQDRAVVVLNQKTVSDAKADEKYEFASPWRKIAFDRVVQVPEVGVAMQPVRGGYIIQAAIPWRLLGITPRSGLRLRGDFGILAADSGGTQTVSRQYWSNKATGLVNDIPGEADLEPDAWGELTLE